MGHAGAVCAIRITTGTLVNNASEQLVTASESDT